MGRCEPGEPVTAAAVRELSEETGVSVRPEGLRLAQAAHGARGAEAPNGFLTVGFSARRGSGGPWNREPHKHARLRWADPASLPAASSDMAATVLGAYLAGTAGVLLEGWA